MQQTIMVVDDEPSQRELIRHLVEEKMNYRAITCDGGQAAVDCILSETDPVPDLLLLDLSMPDVGGMEVIERLRPARPDLPIIVLTMYGDAQKAAAAIRAGATDFLAKPVPHERLRVSIANALRMRALGRELKQYRRVMTPRHAFEDIIGQDAGFAMLVQHCRNLAELAVPAWLQGEAGCGKSMLAQAMHTHAAPSEAPLFTVQAEDFTSSGNCWRRSLQEARGGTLILHRVERWPLEAQRSWLQELHRQPRLLDEIRVIATSRRPVHELISNGVLNPEWMSVLKPAILQVPPLRNRPGDIALLARHFTQRFSALEHRPAQQVSDDAVHLLSRQRWAGNVRQLEQVMLRAVQLGREPVITAVALRPLLPEAVGEAPAAGSVDDASLPLVKSDGKLRRFHEMERDIIRFALAHCEGQMAETARQLGIGRSTLYRKVHDFNIVLPMGVV